MIAASAASTNGLLMLLPLKGDRQTCETTQYQVTFPDQVGRTTSKTQIGQTVQQGTERNVSL
ncbi:hypothetical protein KSC_105120 [Ktedonobacter sp. SOSP1-52]|nr:hypothetical protein KSC_105120 [Ktedonobacter sp. SOSP1-52]